MGDVSTPARPLPPSLVRQYDSYMQFINDCVPIWSEYEWLQRFLAYPSPDISETQVTIFDAVEEKLEERGQFSSRTQDFDQILTSGLGTGSFRLIIVTYNQVWRVDRAIIDKLGLQFDVDPSFFRRHFFYYFNYIEDAFKDDEPPQRRYDEDAILSETLSLPSEESLSEYHFSFTREYDKMSVLLCKDPLTLAEDTLTSKYQSSLDVICTDMVKSSV